MRYITYVLCVLMSVNLKALAKKKCPDCMNINSCDLAKIAVSDNVQKIREAFCGFNDLGTMVCCSYFSDITEGEIENHPNINLLPNECGMAENIYIPVGQAVAIYDFPWMALISSRSRNVTSFHCAGTIINSRYILTTASCIVDKNIIGVRIGEFNLTSKEDCAEDITGERICESHIQDIPVEETIYHENYEGFPAYNYDIGLIRLALPIEFAYLNAAPICLPTTTEFYNKKMGNERAVVTGWGLADRLNAPSVLMKLSVIVYTDHVCMNLDRSFPERRVINFGHNQYCGRVLWDSCNADSGSPLLINVFIDNGLKTIQYGIMFHGHSDCRENFRTMFTAIPPYMLWILDHIKE